MNRETLAEVLTKLRMGDVISDSDLQAALSALRPTVETLRYLGEWYFLAYADLYASLERLEALKKSRKEDRTWLAKRQRSKEPV